MATIDDLGSRVNLADEDGTPEPIRKPKGDSAAADIEAVRVRPRSDKFIWGIFVVLCLISIVELYSASSREIVEGNILGPLFRHIALLGIGCLVMLGLQRVHYDYIYRFTVFIVAAAFVVGIYTFFWGDVVNGARRSFTLFGITIRASEVLKLTAALVIARVLSVSQINGGRDISNRGIATVAVIVLAFGLLLIKQGLTNTLIMMMISLSMMLIGGVSWRKWLIVVGIYGVLGLSYSGYKALTGDDTSVAERNQAVAAGQDTDRSHVRAARMLNFLRGDKYNDKITGENAQEMYSYIAQANGGIFGVAPGNSRETARLPLAFTDYIYAIVVEDLGLVGGLAVIMLFIFLLARAGRVATRCTKAYPALLVIGMAVFVTVQALVHIGIVVGSFPVSGQPLPLLSKGGSSVLITCVALGLMLSVSRHATRRDAREEMRDRITTLSDKTYADNPTGL